LAKGGLKTAVLESGSFVGGTRVGGFERDGFRLDRHIHVLLWCLSLNDGHGNFPVATKELGAPCRFQVLPPNAIWMNATEDTPGQELLLPRFGSGRAVAEWIGVLVGGQLPEESQVAFAKVMDEASSYNWETLWSAEFEEMPAIDWLKSITDDAVVEMLLRHLCAMDMVVPDEISLERCSARSLAACVLAGEFGQRHMCVTSTDGPADTLIEGVCKVITENGGEIFLNHPAKRIVYEGDRVSGVVVADETGKEETWNCKYVIDATNWTATEKLIDEGMTPQIRECLDSLGKTKTIALDAHIGLDKKCINNLSMQCMMVDDSLNYDGVIATFTNLTQHWAPEGKQAVNSELFLWPEEYAKKSPEEWYAQMVHAVYKRWPETKEHTIWEEHFYEEAPVHHGIYTCKRLPNDSGVKGLYFAGDQTVGTGYFFDGAVGSGAKAAKMILNLENKEFYKKNPPYQVAAPDPTFSY